MADAEGNIMMGVSAEISEAESSLMSKLDVKATVIMDLLMKTLDTHCAMTDLQAYLRCQNYLSIPL